MDSEFIKLLKQEKEKMNFSRASNFTIEYGNYLLNNITEKLQLPDNKYTLSIVGILCQQGGTAKGCDGNLSVNLFNRTTKLAEIRSILSELKQKNGLRKLARTYANEIQEICQILEIPGNMHKKIIKMYPSRNFTREELTWLSDFQAENNKCPAELRSLIIEAFYYKIPKRILRTIGK